VAADPGFATVELALALPVLGAAALVGLGLFGVVRAELACGQEAAVAAQLLDDGASDDQAVAAVARAEPPDGVVRLDALSGGLVRVVAVCPVHLPGLLGQALPTPQAKGSALAVPRG
jgi:hypothetical protein